MGSVDFRPTSPVAPRTKALVKSGFTPMVATPL